MSHLKPCLYRFAERLSCFTLKALSVRIRWYRPRCFTLKALAVRICWYRPRCLTLKALAVRILWYRPSCWPFLHPNIIVHRRGRLKSSHNKCRLKTRCMMNHFRTDSLFPSIAYICQWDTIYSLTNECIEITSRGARACRHLTTLGYNKAWAAYRH